MIKNILLIAPVYYDYHTLIIDNLTEKGHSVDFIEDKNSGFLYTLSTKSAFFLKRYKSNYKKEVMLKLHQKSYDYLIVIGGKTLNSDFWKYVNLTFSFKKVLYQWDSLSNFDYREMMPYFDIVKTFDSLDAKELGIPYLPLFYKKELKQNEKEDLDMLFVGTWHSDRIGILNKIADYAIANNLKFCFKVYYPLYMYLYMVYIKKSLRPSSYFIFKPIPFQQMLNFYHRAKCIIDINHPAQAGLTMRTIETIGEGKKLITTNSYIKDEDFYNDKMIQVIDRNNIIIDHEFFLISDDYENIERLEISNWVNELLN